MPNLDLYIEFRELAGIELKNSADHSLGNIYKDAKTETRKVKVG